MIGSTVLCSPGLRRCRPALLGTAFSSRGKLLFLPTARQSSTIDECMQAPQLRDECKDLRVVVADAGSNVLNDAPHLRKIARVWLSLERFCRVDIDLPALEGRVRSCYGEDQALDLDFSRLKPGNRTKAERNQHLGRF